MKIDDLKQPLIFVAGAGIGSLVTWLIVKEKYKQKAEYEIDSVREAYAQMKQSALDKAAAAVNKADISVYAKVLEENAAKHENEEPESEPEIDIGEVEEESYLYEITQEEFASYTRNNNSRINLTYYADDVFSDEVFDIIDPKRYLDQKLIRLGSSDPVDPIDFIRRMKQDEIIIRNDRLGLDIDIDTVGRTYKEYTST